MRRRRRRFGLLMKIPKGAYQKAMKKLRASARVWERYNPGRKAAGKGRSLPAGVHDPATNRDRAVVEAYRFQHRKRATPFMAYLKGQKITNWTGLRLCDITRRSSGRSGFPDVTGRRTARVSFHAKCIDGHSYVGTSPGDGMYARLRPARGR